jgi:oligopeptide transport system ATP-binding protein
VTLLAVEGLGKRYPARGGRELVAVDDVSFTLERGQTLGLVGESGCGKSTVARLVLRLIEPTAGVVRFDGIDVTALGKRELRPLRRRLQIVFQDPVASLNPRLTVRTMLYEPMLVHRIVAREQLKTRAVQLLERVGLAADALDRYPHEFSGGQRQRLGIARALSVQPELIVADEAVSSLDVSVQAQVVNLMNDLQRDLGLAYLFIAHDLHLVEHLSDRVAVMYLGRIVEIGRAASLYASAAHPYTQALLAAAPRLDREPSDTPPRGEPPSPLAPPAGCHFHPRCPKAEERCRTERPSLRVIGDDHAAACHLVS